VLRVLSRIGGSEAEAALAERRSCTKVQTAFAVRLDGFEPAKKINVIKVVWEIAGLGLKEAKDLVEAAPAVVQDILSPEEAETIRKKLQDAGAKVSVA
jgi:large subunit ribosomal protein L7/L12